MIAAKYSTYVILLSLSKIFSSITLQMVIFNYRSNVKNDPNSLLKLIESTDSAKIWLGKSMNHPMMLFRKNYSHLITVGAMSLISLNSTVTRVTHSRGTSAASCESWGKNLEWYTDLLPVTSSLWKQDEIYIYHPLLVSTLELEVSSNLKVTLDEETSPLKRRELQQIFWIFFQVMHNCLLKLLQ